MKIRLALTAALIFLAACERDEITPAKDEPLDPRAIPVLYIWTEDSAPVNSKTEYVHASFWLYAGPGASFLEEEGEIRGRGNATWNYPKKPYKLRFSNPVSPFGMPAEKDWVLLAEFCDKSLMRTAYMCGLSELLGMPYTIRYKITEVYLNGTYEGIYLLADQVERSGKRIDIGEDGFIIEDDNYWYEEPLSFFSPAGRHYTFKYPKDIRAEDPSFSFIKSYMEGFEKALQSEQFRNPETGYRNWIDVPSFAKWYILFELTGNWEPNLYYVLRDRNAKLEMYPGWDAEWSLGLAYRDNMVSGWAAPPHAVPVDMPFWSENGYFKRLLLDDYFKDAVREEWLALCERMPEFEQRMAAVSGLLLDAQERNFERWPIFDQYPGATLVVHPSWLEEVAYVSAYFKERFKWFGWFLVG